MKARLYRLCFAVAAIAAFVEALGLSASSASRPTKVRRFGTG